MDAQHFAAGAYIILLIALVFFIGLSAILIITLNRKLKSTLGREGKGAAYSRAVLLAHEDERARISRDLHDTIAQDLRGLSLQLAAIGKNVGEKEREELSAASAQLRTLVDRVRITCNHLVPPNFRFQGIRDALRHLCHDFGKRTGIECRADIAEGPADDAIDEKMQVQIYRIIQEALTNVAKHA
ncbi:MAG: histidine kinase, partial [Treponema sp.]|nr:histidine kinase [Treponema sp.]